MREWGRLLTAMVTPFDGRMAVDYKVAAELARKLVDEGSEGIVVAGTTGESPTLSSDEKLKLIEAVVEAVGDRAAVLAGTGNNNTADSVALTRKAEVVGVHGVMLVTPYYNKPPQDGLYEHFRTIAEATRLPVMLYNVPGRTSVNMLPETVIRLAEISNIVAVKEASGSLDQVTEIIRKAPAGFRVYSGDDSMTLPVMSVGGHGVVSVVAHVAGRKMRDMIDAFAGGDVARAAALHGEMFPLFKALFVTTNPIPVKRALALSGFDAGGYRLPLVPPSEKETETIRAGMQAAGIL